MSQAILATKLYIPQLQAGVVSRHRLIESLNEGLNRKLTLISAPAGFGKTTLVSEWVVTREHPVAWLSLDEGDSDLTRFLTYLIAALRTIAPNIAAGVLDALQSPQPPPTESTLTALLNEIATVSRDFVLVLDDYHLIDSRPVDDAITFLLAHLPPSMHLVIVTRQDPSLGLARIRAQGQLAELRAEDLRLTPSEAAIFLNETMGLSLSAEDIAGLESRTEGWIAGLQLAALSMQGRDDVSRFIRDFAGDDRYIVDYLVEEVLQRQPEHVRSFLLQTSILSRLSGPLADAVTGRKDSQALLEALERGNFFVVRLDDKRHWYRYHHLFADVLTVQLMSEQPDQVASLHRRASEWHEQHGLTAEAIDHALLAEDFERAAYLVELALPTLRRSRQDATVLGWLEAIPDELIRMRPVLSVGYAWSLLAGRRPEGVEARLRDAERWLGPEAATGEQPPDTASTEVVIVDAEEFRHLPATIAVYRAVDAELHGDLSATVKFARQVLALSPEDDDLRRGAAAALLGLASWASGDLEEAHRAYSAGMARIRMAGNISDAIGGAMVLADIQVAQGHLREAMRTYEQALQLATEQGDPVPRGTADLYIGMSELLREHDDLNAAAQHLQQSKELAERVGLPHNRSRWCAAMARLREAHGDLGGALDLLGEADRLFMSDFSPDVYPLAASRARIWVAQGRLREALDWTRERGLSVDDDLTYLREFEHITLARVLLARGKSDRDDRSAIEAMHLLNRLRKAAEDGGRTGSLIEILVLEARAHYGQGDVPAALIPLQQALALAEPEGYVRIFVDEGPPIAALLGRVAKQRIATGYVRELLAGVGKVEDRTPVEQRTIEPLSERELDVLRLLTTDLDGPEIARQLMVSLNTLRTHTKNIYAKLGVNSRRAAVHRADDLGLLSRSRNH